MVALHTVMTAARSVGVLVPLLVRAGKKGEKPSMALDGRRRLLVLKVNLEGGANTEDHFVKVVTLTSRADFARVESGGVFIASLI